jgi:pilus assembly protein CpaE
MSNLTLVATELLPGAAAALMDSLAEHGPLAVLGYAGDGLEAAQMALRLRPDVLLVHAEMPGMDGLQVAQIVSQAAPEVACVLMVEKPDEDLLHLAMLAGARAVISPSMGGLAIFERLTQVAGIGQVRGTVEYARAVDPKQAPMCVAVASAVGGAGRTTVATNLAIALAQKAPKDCVLVEISPQASRIAHLLNLQPQSGLADMTESGEGWPDYTLDSCLVEHSSGLRLLAGGGHGGPPGLLDRISVGFMAALVGHIRRRYRFAIFCMPPTLWSAGLYLLRRCDRVLMVTTGGDVLRLHDTAAQVEALAGAGVPRDNLVLVVNRVSKGDPVSAAQMRERCGLRKAVELPADPRVLAEAMSAMTPAVLGAPASPFSRGVLSLAEWLLTSAGQGPQTRPAQAFQPQPAAASPAMGQAAGGTQ